MRDLQRNGTLNQRFMAKVDDTHSAATDFPYDAVTPYLPRTAAGALYWRYSVSGWHWVVPTHSLREQAPSFNAVRHKRITLQYEHAISTTLEVDPR